MGKKTTKKTARTINQKGATKPAAFKKPAKGAVKGAAKDELK